MTRRYSVVHKDINGVVHLPQPDLPNQIPWCARHLTLALSEEKRLIEQLLMRLRVWNDEPVTCIRCVLLGHYLNKSLNEWVIFFW